MRGQSGPPLTVLNIIIRKVTETTIRKNSRRRAVEGHKEKKWAGEQKTQLVYLSKYCTLMLPKPISKFVSGCLV